MRLAGHLSVVFNYMFSKDSVLTCEHLVYDKHKLIGRQPGRILTQRGKYSKMSKYPLAFH